MKRKKYKKRKIFFVPNFTLPRRKVSYAKTLRRGSFIWICAYLRTRRKDFIYKSVRRGFPNRNIHIVNYVIIVIKKTASDQKDYGFIKSAFTKPLIS
jgi:hypothetical protein